MATKTAFDVARAIRILLEARPDLTTKMGWEQAYAVGISPSEWSLLKRGKRSSLQLRTLIGLCRGFGVDLPTFLRLGGMPEEEVQALLPYLRADLPAKADPNAHNLTITAPPSVTHSKKAAVKGKTVKVTEQLECEPLVPNDDRLDFLFGKKLPYTPSDILVEGGTNATPAGLRQLSHGSAPRLVPGRREAPLAQTAQTAGAR